MIIFLTFLSALSILLLLFFILIHMGFRAPRIAEKKNPGDFGLKYRPVNIPNVKGKKLFAWYLMPFDDPSAPTLLIMHGWGANAQMMLPLAKPFYKNGMNILLIDARSHGQSPRDGYSSMPKFAEDVGCAIDWLRAHTGKKDGGIALLGHSVGAAAVLLAASKRDDVDAVISLSSFAHPKWMMRRQLMRLPLLSFLSPLILGYVQWVIGHRYDAIAPINSICSIKCPVLLVHGSDDETIPVDDMRAIKKNCTRARSEVLLIPGAGHASISKIRDYADDLIAFLKRAGLQGL